MDTQKLKELTLESAYHLPERIKSIRKEIATKQHELEQLILQTAQEKARIVGEIAFNSDYKNDYQRRAAEKLAKSESEYKSLLENISTIKKEIADLESELEQARLLFQARSMEIGLTELGFKTLPVSSSNGNGNGNGKDPNEFTFTIEDEISF